MDIPIVVKCVTCGMVLADKFIYYKEEVRKRKLNNQGKENIENNDNLKYNLEGVLYFTNTYKNKTFEGEVLDEMDITKICCRRHFISKV
jgi:DNA-directed RNA polymerase I, II, and III subunit RPABC5